MADGSTGDRAGPQKINDLTFSAPDTGHGDIKKCSGETFEGDRVNLLFYTELGTSESCEKSDTRGVAANRTATGVSSGSRKSSEVDAEESEDRKKRCFDRYDSSESSDRSYGPEPHYSSPSRSSSPVPQRKNSGVAVLSPTESSGCSSSDITEPRSPRSPESSCSTSDDSGCVGTRMPPWASESAPPRRLAAQPAPVRRPNPPVHRRITEYFNHRMKPQNGLKRECSTVNNDDTKRKCLPKNGVTHDLEKYISFLSQTLSPKVLLDVGKQADATRKTNGVIDGAKAADLSKSKVTKTKINGVTDFNRSKDNMEKVHTTMNGFIEVRHANESSAKEKVSKGPFNSQMNSKKQGLDLRKSLDPSANGIVNTNKVIPQKMKRKIPTQTCNNFNGISGLKIAPATEGMNGLRLAPATSSNQSLKGLMVTKPDTSKMNGVVSSTTKLDNRMNGVTCGSNNLSLNISCKLGSGKKEAPKKAPQAPKRRNRKSSACIANSKNLTWSKANNLKQQVQHQKQNCNNALQSSSLKSGQGEAITAPKMNIRNGVRQVSMTVNGSLSNLNVPVTNLQNCHQLNIPQVPQPCNGTVTSTNLPSFVAVPQNVMLTTLRIPQNGIQAQTLNQQNNMNAFNRPNVNVSSPTKLNGQFVFPLMQNLNGAVVQIPNLMAKMPNFVLPQTQQLAQQRQDHLQNQQAAQILINGTLLKLANTMTSTYTNINKSVTATSQSIPVMNKNVTGMSTVGMSVQPKPNYTVNLSHPMLMPQSGFIVTSVPNINVKETWSYTTTNTVASSQSSYSNPMLHHPPIGTSFAQALHSSSIPIAPVKPPDNPIQGTDPPSSTVKEHEIGEITTPRCDIPWLSKTVNNNIVPLDSKLPSRPFAHVNSMSDKFDALRGKIMDDKKTSDARKDNMNEELRKVEEVARREETIFTQITVLKDVLSNVQNSVIEANYSSATTESSESGIGTDKSIDSPSDSQTSKECDDDSSSLSLSVSVCSVDTQSCQKSPILKQPKILRFPPRNLLKPDSNQRTSSTDTSSTVTLCLWENCKSEFDSDSDLLEHLQSIHVESQAGKENYVCLWSRCKVRGKPSCSRLWLERHALSHGGNKPFKCIVDSCERRFSTQILLERHVNNHFTEASPNAGGSKKTTESGAKLIRRNGKKLRYRRQPWSARMFDFFDAGTMEGLAWRLMRCTRWRLGGACPLREPAGRHTLTLHSAITASRYNVVTARREALLTYYPPHVIEDEWVPEKDVKRIKRVEISELPAATKVLLYEEFCSSYRKTPAPPPVKKTSQAAVPARLLPARQCTSSRLLNNLLSKKKSERNECTANNMPLVYGEEDKTEKVEVSGAKKRKMGRRHGGNAFWPCGR